MTYPYSEGDNVVLGPEVFASGDERVVCWKGVNYYLTDENIANYVAQRYASRIPPGTLQVGDIVHMRSGGEHFNPVTGEMQHWPWTEDRPDEPAASPPVAVDPKEHILQFRGRADGQIDAYCRNSECHFRLVVEADRDVNYFLVLDIGHREGNDR